MVAVHRQSALSTSGLIMIQGLLQLRLQLERNFLLQLGLQIVQQSHDSAPPVNQQGRPFPHSTTKPPKSERYRMGIENQESGDRE